MTNNNMIPVYLMLAIIYANFLYDQWRYIKMRNKMVRECKVLSIMIDCAENVQALNATALLVDSWIQDDERNENLHAQVHYRRAELLGLEYPN